MTDTSRRVTGASVPSGPRADVRLRSAIELGCKTVVVAMREECKNFQSRTYASGEVARFCVLDLAPEAPWRCPDNCPKYSPRLADVGWVHGSLVEPAIEDEPNVPVDRMQEVLGEAEKIVNDVAPDALEAERKRQKRQRRRWPRPR